MTSERIKTLYEDCGMTVEEIAATEEVDLSIVKASLSQTSKFFNESLKEGEEQDITDAEYKTFLAAYKSLALTTDNPNVQEKSLRYLIDEKKGRNDLKLKALNAAHSLPNQFNVLVLQESLEASQRVKSKILKNRKAPVIELATKE